MASEIGSLEVGKRADIIVVDPADRPNWSPVGDPLLSLVWGGGGEAVRTVLVGGRIVVDDGTCRTIDAVALRAEVDEHRRRLLAAAGVEPVPVWPIGASAVRQPVVVDDYS